MWHDASCLSETLGAALSDRDEADALDEGYLWTLLPRHGRRPIRFLSREMLRVDNRAGARARAVTHWSEIQIYEIYRGGFVTAVRHVCTEDDHAGFQDAWMAESARDVIALLQAHDAGAALPVDEAPSPAAPAKAWLDLVNRVFAADMMP